jgi:hypothetical protein
MREMGRITNNRRKGRNMKHKEARDPSELPPEEWAALLAEMIKKFTKVHREKLLGGSRFGVVRIYRAEDLPPAILEEIRSASEEELRALEFHDLGHVFFEPQGNRHKGYMMLVMKSAMEQIRPSN